MMKETTNKFVQADDAYKYLSAEQQSFIDGLHAALGTVEGLLCGEENSELQTNVGDYIADAVIQSDDSNRSEVLAAYDKIGGTVCKQAAEEVCTALRGEITRYVDGFLGGMYDYEERREKIDKHYAELELTPDMTLLDDEGYTVGVIRALDTDKDGQLLCIIVLEEPDEDGALEWTLTADEVKTFTLCAPQPQYVSYVKGKKVSHFKYGGDKVEEMEVADE